ncbi:MAG: DNA polymerase III subunit gamma/tau [Gloeobacterales cyanobacterium]
MTYEPLYHKYRPQTFLEIVGQEAIVRTLSSAIRSDRMAHAYLFTGSRGTGKTSTARIMAKSLNCIQGPTPIPCGVCELCTSITRGSALDIIEIDAASNTGVDNIRELIERAQFAPVQARFKVYIIDEVHMLSNAAFNALLKTLEEPPNRVVFILATTDAQRVLPTIISRCQRFDFRRIPLGAMVTHLTHIATVEGISISAEAVELVAQIAQGGLRDAESLLDQLSLLEGEIGVEAIWNLVGAVPERDLLILWDSISAGDSIQVLTQTRRLMDTGKEPIQVIQDLTAFCRDLLIAQQSPDRRDLVSVTAATWTALLERAKNFSLSQILSVQERLKASEPLIKNTTQPRLWLEVTLLGLLQETEAKAPTLAPISPLSRPLTSRTAPTAKPVADEREPAYAPPKVSAPAPASREASTPSPVVPTKPSPPPAKTSAGAGSSTLARDWDKFASLLDIQCRPFFIDHIKPVSEAPHKVVFGISSLNLIRQFKAFLAKKRLDKAFLETLGYIPMEVTFVLRKETEAMPEEDLPEVVVSSPAQAFRSAEPAPSMVRDLPSRISILPKEDEEPPIKPRREEAFLPVTPAHGSSERPRKVALHDMGELDRASHSLADFFAGQIVSETDQAVPVKTDRPLLVPVEAEDDDDDIDF